MTREEEIRKAIDIMFPIPASVKGRKYEQALMATGFETGVQWADDNLKSPWISVKDDLPCNHKELISGEDKRNTIHVFVLVRGLVVLSRMEKFEGEWHWITDDPTYWMIIPELPK